MRQWHVRQCCEITLGRPSFVVKTENLLTRPRRLRYGGVGPAGRRMETGAEAFSLPVWVRTTTT